MRSSHPKRLVICADGTWNKVEEFDPSTKQYTSTNVALLATLLARSHTSGEEQRLFYMEGVGTADEERISGGAFGFGLKENVERGFRFLVRNYAPGDHIYLFGFSRGAYTARSLAGLIRNCGILRPEHEDRVGEAMRIYTSPHPDLSPHSIRSQVFRQMHSNDAEIDFVGVWDTVGSLGIPFLCPNVAKSLGWDWHFHDTRLGSHILHARHAMAMHERRYDFPPTLWFKKKGWKTENSLKQRWFPGVHSDIGGGYLDRDVSDKTLLWMLEETMALPDGRELAFRESGIDELRSKAARPIRNIHDSWQGAFRFLDRLRGHSQGRSRQFLEAGGEAEMKELKLGPNEPPQDYLTNVEFDPSCKEYRDHDALHASLRDAIGARFRVEDLSLRPS